MTSVDNKSGKYAISVRSAQFGYSGGDFNASFDLYIPHGVLAILIGPNGAGKSTLLRLIAGIESPATGDILVNGSAISGLARRQIARKLAILPQQRIAPMGITVEELVRRGRFAHRGWFSRWTSADQEIVENVLQRTRTVELRHRVVQELSGGQQQRVWIAMVLAQNAQVVLLDEPTAFLDLAHQLELLEICRELVRSGVTVVAALHDLNLASMYADLIVAASNGSVVASGTPQELMNENFLLEVFGLKASILIDPATRAPLVVPKVLAGEKEGVTP